MEQMKELRKFHHLSEEAEGLDAAERRWRKASSEFINRESVVFMEEESLGLAMR